MTPATGTVVDGRQCGQITRRRGGAAVPGQHRVEPGDGRVGTVDDGHSDRDPAAVRIPVVQPGDQFAMDRAADEDQVRVAVRLGVLQS